MFMIYPHGQYVWSDAEFRQCIAIIKHGGSTEISDILGKLWGYLNQKYLKYLVKKLFGKRILVLGLISVIWGSAWVDWWTDVMLGLL